MRIWSLHPRYLDTKGLVALWRETLLAKNVLSGNTKWYKNHPQLKRFKNTKNPLNAINQYLAEVYEEAVQRNYNFDREKINWDFEPTLLTVTHKQMAYEKKHLQKKLQTRDPKKFEDTKNFDIFMTHPLFQIIEWEIEDWEVIISE